jgi:hypothetical protein
MNRSDSLYGKFRSGQKGFLSFEVPPLKEEIKSERMRDCW